MNIKQIQQDWADGMTHGEIVAKHTITRAQEFAINCCSTGLSYVTIASRIGRVGFDMTAEEIRFQMELPE